MRHSRQISLSSFPLQVALLVSMVCAVLWFVGTVAALTYKAMVLPYPEGVIGAEYVGVIFVLVLELLYHSMGSRGNLLEFQGPLAFAVFVGIVQVAYVVYTVRFQPYVVQLDFYFGIVYLAGKGLSVLLMANQFLSLSFVSQTL